MDDTELPPAVPIPERLDRKLRLGPFPSGRDALKFVGYIAIGALLVPWAGVVAWVPFVLLGLAVSLWRPEGEGVDTRVLRWFRWELRRGSDRPGRKGGTVTPVGRGAVVPLSTGGYAAILRSGGIPLAYLPPAELRRRFDLYRELLRTVDRSLVLLSTRSPIHRVTYLPAEPSPVGEERVAREGYRELVDVIVRRRSVRHVFLALTEPGSGAEAVGRLERQVGSMAERLAALGLRPVRLRDRSLGEAAARLGLVSRGGEP